MIFNGRNVLERKLHMSPNVWIFHGHTLTSLKFDQIRCYIISTVSRWLLENKSMNILFILCSVVECDKFKFNFNFQQDSRYSFQVRLFWTFCHPHFTPLRGRNITDPSILIPHFSFDVLSSVYTISYWVYVVFLIRGFK